MGQAPQAEQPQAEHHGRRILRKRRVIYMQVEGDTVTSRASQEPGFNEAIKSYDAALEKNPADSKMWLKRACIAHKFREYAEALDSCGKALEIDPKCTAALIYQGIAYQKLGNPADAIACYDKAISANPNDSHAWFYKGGIAKFSGDLETALECYERVAQLIGEGELGCIARFNKGQMHLKIGEFEDAVECFHASLEVANSFPKVAGPFPNFRQRAWLQIGIALNKLGRYGEAIASLSRALEPELNERGQKKYSLDALIHMGKSYKSLEEFRNAVECINKAIKIDPCSCLWQCRGDIHRDMGSVEQAIEDYQKSLELDPANPAVQKNKEELIEGIRRREDMEACESALEKAPENVELLFKKAGLSEQAGDFEAAAASYDRILNLCSRERSGGWEADVHRAEQKSDGTNGAGESCGGTAQKRGDEPCNARDMWKVTAADTEDHYI